MPREGAFQEEEVSSNGVVGLGAGLSEHEGYLVEGRKELCQWGARSNGQIPDRGGLWREWEVRKLDVCDQLFQELGCERGER